VGHSGSSSLDVRAVAEWAVPSLVPHLWVPLIFKGNLEPSSR
jgi:hypothetical protein